MTDRYILDAYILDGYILDGHKGVRCPNLLEWAKWFEIADRDVGKTCRDGVRVSTVFLGLDHNYGDGPPLLFETMIFGGEHDASQWRYSTWEEAAEGHRAACELAFGKMQHA